MWWCPTWDARNCALAAWSSAATRTARSRDGGRAAARPRGRAAFARARRPGAGLHLRSSARRRRASRGRRAGRARRAALAAARFDRELDTSWRRTSYSALTARGPRGLGGVTSRRRPASRTSRRAAPPAGCGRTSRPGCAWAPPSTPRWRAWTSPRRTSAPRCRRSARCPGLREALGTPLGPPFGVRLADITHGAPPRRAVLRAAAGRRRPGAGEVTLARLADDPRRARRPVRPRACAELGDARAARLPHRLAGPRRPAAGRRASPSSTTRPTGCRRSRPPRSGGDAPPPLRAAGAALHGRAAPLPALAARPARSIAGVGYLFLRGMDGTEGAGVFTWTPPAARSSRR